MIRLEKNYRPEQIAYLHSEPTHEIWYYICDLIKKHNSKNIIDVGCATAALNYFLHDYDYNYYGFDASQNLIDEAKRIWNKPNINVWCSNWDDIDLKINCDCMLLLGVLPYGEPKWCNTNYNNAFELYTHLVKKFKPRHVIIRETDQLVDGEEVLNISPFLTIAHSIKKFSVDTVFGKKVVLNVITS